MPLGGLTEHFAFAAEVLCLVRNAMVDSPCRVHTSDLRIHVEAAGSPRSPTAA